MTNTDAAAISKPPGTTAASSLVVAAASLVLIWNDRLSDIVVHVVVQHVTLRLPPAMHSVPTHKTAIVVLACPPRHLEQAQLQQQFRVPPEPFPEPSDGSLVHAQRSSSPSRRPALPQRPQDEALLLRVEPRMAVGSTAFGSSLPEPLSQRLLRQVVLRSRLVRSTGSVTNIVGIAPELYTNYSPLADERYANHVVRNKEH